MGSGTVQGKKRNFTAKGHGEGLTSSCMKWTFAPTLAFVKASLGFACRLMPSISIDFCKYILANIWARESAVLLLVLRLSMKFSIINIYIYIQKDI